MLLKPEKMAFVNPVVLVCVPFVNWSRNVYIYLYIYIFIINLSWLSVCVSLTMRPSIKMLKWVILMKVKDIFFVSVCLSVCLSGAVGKVTKVIFFNQL